MSKRVQRIGLRRVPKGEVSEWEVELARSNREGVAMSYFKGVLKNRHAFAFQVTSGIDEKI